MNAAIQHVFERELGPRGAGPLQTLLVFKYLETQGITPSIDSVDAAVQEIFGLIPGHERGRLNLSGGSKLWGVLEASGRKTVWDHATRTGGREFFDPEGAWDQDSHEPHPLRDDAVEVAYLRVPAKSRNLLIARDALAILLSWNQEFDEDADLDDITASAQERFGLENHEWDRLTAPAALPAGLELFSDQEWTPQGLPPNLRPDLPASPVADRRLHHETAVIPLRVDPRTLRMVRLAILSTSAVLLVGPPGTGKTRLLRDVVDDLRANHEDFRKIAPPLWRTPEESWTSREIVGGPTVVPGSNEIRFRPGLVPRAIAENRWLILDELNRGDADRIFGGLITWLSDQSVEIGHIREEADSPVVRLEWTEDSESRAHPDEAPLAEDDPTEDVAYRAGKTWRLLGTYNGQDAQRVFRFGQALGRRFQQVPVPAMDPDDFEKVLEGLDASEALPLQVAERVSALYRAHFENEDTRVGPASFFKVRTYLAQAIEGELPAAAPKVPGLDEDLEPEGPPATDVDETTDGVVQWVPSLEFEEFVAEGYVISLGQRLAALDDLTALSQRIQEAGAITAGQWAWVEDRIRDFG